MTFGARVQVKAKLRRGEQWKGGTSINRFWERKELKTPREGLYIGKRSLSNGHYFYEDGYEHKESVAALLVVLSEREKPIYVLPEDVSEVSI